MGETERLKADNERLQGDVTRLTEQARGRAIREVVGELAPTLGIGDPRLAAKLLDSAKVEWGEDGQPKRKALEKTLEELKREFPSITARTRGSADAGAGGSSAANDSDISARIRARLRGEG